jgi:hypothetical protein
MLRRPPTFTITRSDADRAIVLQIRAPVDEKASRVRTEIHMSAAEAVELHDLLRSELGTLQAWANEIDEEERQRAADEDTVLYTGEQIERQRAHEGEYGGSQG